MARVGVAALHGGPILELELHSCRLFLRLLPKADRLEDPQVAVPNLVFAEKNWQFFVAANM